jgi:beta-galactosidase
MRAFVSLISSTFLVLVATLTFSQNLIAHDLSFQFSTRKVSNINREWKYQKGDVPGADAELFDDSSWSNIDLPHTWNNLDGQDGGGNYYRGMGWYRKSLHVSKRHEGKSIYLKFDGANIVTDLYVNGIHVGQHRGGFAAFCFDVTSHIRFGESNLIAVRVNNASNPSVAPLSADFTFFGGIYRDVHLLVTDKLSVTPLDYASPGLYLKQTNVTKERAEVEILTKVRNGFSTAKDTRITAIVVNPKGVPVKFHSQRKTIEPGFTQDVLFNTRIDKPLLWNGREGAHLYKVYIIVSDNRGVVDIVEQPLGLRYFHIDVNEGFFLNGRYLDIRGGSRHQDRLNKGWAISEEDQREDFELIKELGATGIRLAHYQHAEYFYDLCDKGGMVVWAELALVNKITESAEFYENAKEQLKELVRQNYNHPSIFFWGVHNEITISSGPNPDRLIQELAELVKVEDPTRLSTVASHNDTASTNWHTDLIGFNKYFGWYNGSFMDFGVWADAMHATIPDKPMGMSEYGAGASIYQHFVNPPRPDTTGDYHPEEYQSLLHEAHWKAMAERPYLWCKFVWNLFDFAIDSRDEGDTAGRNDKGLITYDRKIRKDAYYWYKANWNGEPMVYITGRRHVPVEGERRDIKVYSNCDSVELKVNGVSRGTKNSLDKIFLWEGIDLSGEIELEAKGLKDGREFGDRVTWTAIPVKRPIIAEGQELLIDENFSTCGGMQNLAGGRWFCAYDKYLLRGFARGFRGRNGNISLHPKQITSSSYSLSVEATADSTRNGEEEFSLIFGFQGIDNYLYASFSESAGPLRNGLIAVRGGVATKLIDFPVTFPTRANHSVRVAIDGQIVKVYMGDNLISEVSLGFTLTGGVGIGSQSSNVMFDNFRVITREPLPAT